MSGIPHVRIDGLLSYVGADLCPIQTQTYTNGVNQRLNATGGMSPVKISGRLSIDGNLATMTAHYELVDPGSFTVHQATLFIYEDDITWCCGYGGVDHWDDVVRMARSTPVSLTTVGQIETVVETLNISGMVAANLHPVAIFEEIGGTKTVIQASDFITLDLEFLTRVQSVPEGNDAAYFEGTVTNIGQEADVATLSVDTGFGWPTDFQVEGDPDYYQIHDVTLGPGETIGVTVRVQTDGVKRIGSGSFKAQSQGTGNTSSVVLRVFNDSYAVLLVDDDNNTSYELPFTTALTSLGYLFDTVATANAAAMRGFDVVIWQTAYQTATLDDANMEALMTYLDSGGRLFLSSMDLLTTVTPPSTFVTDYLGVASWTNNTRASFAVGVGGDPISDGMNIELDWPVSNANRVDTVNPVNGATAFLFSETNNPGAVRFEAGRGFRSVFNTICQDAFPTNLPDPNNSETVIEKTLNWLLTSDPTSVDDSSPAAASLILRSGPNPTRGATEVRFALSTEGARHVRLSIVDASGRHVRQLHEGAMDPGGHRMTWDAADDAGHPVATGVYFARLETVDGISSGKVIVVR